MTYVSNNPTRRLRFEQLPSRHSPVVRRTPSAIHGHQLEELSMWSTKRTFAIALLLLAVSGGAAQARPRKSRAGATPPQASSSGWSSTDEKRPQEGARNRIDATEDAARDAEATRNQRLRWAPF
jgi:hypothetical protein